MVTPNGAWTTIRSGGRRAALLALAWWAFGGANGSGVVVGVIAVVLATCGSLTLSGPFTTTLRLGGLAKLLGVFAIGSLRGGWDVAWRALSPRAALHPAILRYRTWLEPGFPQQLFGSVGALMPGTLAVGGTGQEVAIHLLVDRGDESRRELAVLESSVAAALGLERSAGDSGDE
jgi:multicomponent Na+:H+ antiporter subunit E